MGKRASTATGTVRSSGGTRLRSLADAHTLRQLVGSLREGIYVSTQKGDILDANGAFLQLIGVGSLDELRRYSAYDLFLDPYQRARELELLSRDGAVHEFEFQIRRPDGEIRTVLDACTAVKDPEADDVLFYGVLVDITDRKRTELALRESEANFRALVDQAIEAIYVLQDDRFVLVNPAWERLFGYSQADVQRPDFSYLSIVAPESEPLVRQRIRQRAHGLAVPPRFEMRGRAKDGRNFDLLVSVADILWQGRPAIQGVYHDVTEQKRASEDLSRTLSLLATTLESTADGILVVDNSGRISTFNNKFVEMWRIPDDIVGSRDDARALAFVADQLKDQDGFLRKVRELYATPEAESYDELHFKDGRVFERYSVPQRITGTVVGRVWSFRDVTSRKTAEWQLVHDAFHDALTSLPNRALFTDLLSRSIGRAQRREDYAFAVLFLDVDRFKVVNDSLGHMIGDQLLIAIARRIERCIRPGDTVARLSGDEFTILLDDIEEVSDATRVADRIQHELAQPFNLSGQDIFTSASIGIALSATGYQRPEDLLRDADLAMYRAKALGKARYEVFDLEMHARAVAQLQLETDLRRALERQEFAVHYQPIVSLQTGRVIGFEALCRWQHPQRGLVMPGEFIPVAEETGLIVPIGRWVLHQACRQVFEWQARFPSDPSLTVSVNISAKQFLQPDLVEQIAEALAATGLRPPSLRLEITESVIIGNVESATQMLERLRALEVRLDLDDFGTGYSSLSYLHRFEMDAIKIDRAFVTAIGERGENSEIVRTIVTLARNLSMEAIAEGVETAEQLSLLRTLDCEHVQGFLFSQPLPAERAGALLAAARSGH